MFEGLHNICIECGKYEHSTKACPLLQKEGPTPPPQETAPIEPQEKKAMYGEWMMVKSRNEKKQGSRTKGTQAAHEVDENNSRGNGSRFLVLEQEESPVVMETETLTLEEALEDQNTTIRAPTKSNKVPETLHMSNAGNRDSLASRAAT
ncbi:unnamed protein product [Linum trigynum]|uniref:CCHC-type domain-containing protein n=1 Tax=Linum trigynum TaxID=586398 RepID=A0AAV2CTX1_9ROSI